MQDDHKVRLSLARALVSQAELKEKNGDSEGALATCEQALELSPREHTAHEIIHVIWNKRGNAAMEQGDVEKALAAYQQAGAKGWDDAVNLVRRALDEDSALFHTRFYLGEVLLDLGRTDEALAEVTTVLMAYQQASPERQQEIIVFFRNILEQKPTRTLARLLLGQLLINSQPTEALSELKQAYEDDKSNNKSLLTFILLTRAEAAHVKGEWWIAFNDCIRALEIDPTLTHALESMKEMVTQVKDVGTKATFGIDRIRLCELAYTAKRQIRLLGVVALNPDWQTLARKWVASLKDEPTFDITILCESDNTLFSKSLTYDMDTTENRRSFQELQFIRDRALIDFPDMLARQGIPVLGNDRIIIEIMHLPIPVSIVQIDDRIFANLWLHDIEDRFEEIAPTHPWYSHMKKYVSTYFDPMRGRKYANKPGEEMLEVFDHKRTPRGIYPRSSFYDTDYEQLVVWGFIFDRQGRLLIHRRADNAKDNQGMWDKSVGGHTDLADFDTSKAIPREVIEELFSEELKQHKSDFTAFAISDEDIIFMGDWRPEQRKWHPFNEIKGFTREWAYFRLRDDQRLYSPRILPDGKERRLRVIADVFLFVAGPQLTDESLKRLKNSAFKLIELSDLKVAMDKSLRKENTPDFEPEPLPKFSPDLVNVMTGKLRDVLGEYSQYIKKYMQ